MNQWVSTLFRSMGGRWHGGSLSLPSHSGSLQQSRHSQSPDGVKSTGSQKQLLFWLYSHADLTGVPHTVQEARRATKFIARGSGDLPSLDSGAHMGSEDMLPNEEVVRRLRLLGQPATLFGEVRCPTSSSLVLVCTDLHTHLTPVHHQVCWLHCCLLAAYDVVS